MQRKFIPNDYRIVGNIAYLQLTNRGTFIAEALIDVADLERTLTQCRWRAAWDDHARSYYVRGGSRPIRRLHRFLLDAAPSVLVDHKNHNTLDCRRENIRECTIAQNNQNRPGPNRITTSGVRNVSWDRTASCWRVRLKVAGRSIHIGCHPDIEIASRMAAEARQKHMEFSTC